MTGKGMPFRFSRMLVWRGYRSRRCAVAFSPQGRQAYRSREFSFSDDWLPCPKGYTYIIWNEQAPEGQMHLLFLPYQREEVFCVAVSFFYLFLPHTSENGAFIQDLHSINKSLLIVFAKRSLSV